MNKPVIPEQLELAPTTSAPVEPRFCVRMPGPDPDDFDWDNPDEDSIVLREQRATAAYRNKAGELVIRQRAGVLDDRDTFIWVSPENEVAFLEGLAKRARES